MRYRNYVHLLKKWTLPYKMRYGQAISSFLHEIKNGSLRMQMVL